MNIISIILYSNIKNDLESVHGWFEENEDEIGDMANILNMYSIIGVMERNMAVCDAYETTNIRTLLEHINLLTVLFNEMVSEKQFHFNLQRGR